MYASILERAPKRRVVSHLPTARGDPYRTITQHPAQHSLKFFQLEPRNRQTTNPLDFTTTKTTPRPSLIGNNVIAAKMSGRLLPRSHQTIRSRRWSSRGPTPVPWRHSVKDFYDLQNLDRRTCCQIKNMIDPGRIKGSGQK